MALAEAARRKQPHACHHAALDGLSIARFIGSAFPGIERSLVVPPRAPSSVRRRRTRYSVAVIRAPQSAIRGCAGRAFEAI